MEIRGIKDTDIPSLELLIEEFHENAVEIYGLRCDKELIKEGIRKQRDNILILVTDNKVVGVVGGSIVEYPLENRKIYQEMIWYVTEKYRRYGVKLLRALEAQCKERGIEIIIMVALGSSMAEKLGRVYKLMGYKELETHYLKVIK